MRCASILVMTREQHITTNVSKRLRHRSMARKIVPANYLNDSEKMHHKEAYWKHHEI